MHKAAWNYYRVSILPILTPSLNALLPTLITSPSRISNIIAPAISKTLFLQFLIAALALGISVVNIVYFIDDLFKAGKFLTLVFVIFLHMFPCCYYGNKYSENNGKILNALYSCQWINQDEKFKKTLIIFMEFNHATRYFWAGKIIPINLATFVSVRCITLVKVTIFYLSCILIFSDYKICLYTCDFSEQYEKLKRRILDMDHK